jgi:hypothetical protein
LRHAFTLWKRGDKSWLTWLDECGLSLDSSLELLVYVRKVREVLVFVFASWEQLWLSTCATTLFGSCNCRPTWAVNRCSLQIVCYLIYAVQL